MIGLLAIQTEKHLSQEENCILYNTHCQSYQCIKAPMDKGTDEKRHSGNSVSELCIQET